MSIYTPPLLIDLTPKGQKFKRGQVVWVGRLSKFQSHFPQNCYGIIVGSYDELCPSKHSVTSYSLLVKKNGRWTSSAWFDEEDLHSVKYEEFRKVKEDYEESLDAQAN